MRAIFSDEGLARLAQTSVLVVGCGLLGRRIAELLALSGYGQLSLTDPQVVAPENALQGYGSDEVNKPKVVACAEALGRYALQPLRVHAWACSFEELSAQSPDALNNIDIAVVATDNMLGRHAVSRYFYGRTPVIVGGLSEDGPHGFVYLQEPQGICLQCALPQLGVDEGAPCTAITPDIAFAIAGLCVHAANSLVVGGKRACPWALRIFSLAGDIDFLRGPEELVAQQGCSTCGPGRKSLRS